ncbi:MAG: flagellar protein FlgN [Chloroflexota bacterium]|jgi:hypothetical protein
MVNHDSFTEYVLDLEEILVSQFREVQQVIELTLTERETLLKNGDDLMPVVEEKEALLDRLGVIEDNRRRVVQKLSLECGLVSPETSIGELLPYLDSPIAQRVSRLAEGISTLAVQARELNDYNQALACTRLDWLRAAQVFLVGVVQPEAGYRSPLAMRPVVETANWGMEYRA